MPVNPEAPDEAMIQHPPGLPPPNGHPPANANNDIPMDPDDDMHQPPLLPDENPNEDNNDAPDDPMPPDDPPHPPHPDNHTPGPDHGTQPPDQPPSQPQFPLPGPHPPGPPFPGTTVPQPPHQPIPLQPHPTTLPLQPIPPDAFIPSLVVPPSVTDSTMQHSIKRESGQPVSSPQKAKAPAPGNQMPAPSGSSTRKHLGGDVPVSISSSSKPQDPKPDNNSDDDETDPQAGPSSGPPILPVDENDDQRQQNEGNNDDKSDTLEYNSAPEGITDSDDTVEYQDLVTDDDASWSLLTQEQKICSNTGSFSIPRYIDNSPVDVMHVRSSNSYADRQWTYRGQKNVRKNYSDITEVYEHISPEDSAFMTLYQSLDKSSVLVGKKRN